MTHDPLHVPFDGVYGNPIFVDVRRVCRFEQTESSGYSRESTALWIDGCDPVKVKGSPEHVLTIIRNALKLERTAGKTEGR